MNSNFTMYKLGMIYICIVWHPGGIGSVANDQYFLGLQNRHKYKTRKYSFENHVLQNHLILVKNIVANTAKEVRITPWRKPSQAFC